MTVNIYVDGSGGPNGGYGYFIKETGESFYEKKPDITNNQAEYLAIISALKKVAEHWQKRNDKTENQVTIFSDSKNTVSQLNHDFAINNEHLRNLAREAWMLLGNLAIDVKIQWIPRKENLAGKMLGS